MFKAVGKFQHLDQYGNPRKHRVETISICFEPKSPFMWIEDTTSRIYFKEVKAIPTLLKFCHLVNRRTTDGMVFALVPLWYIESKPLLGETTFESTIPWFDFDDGGQKTLDVFMLARDKLLKEYESKGL